MGDEATEREGGWLLDLRARRGPDARAVLEEALATISGGVVGELIGHTEPRLWTRPLVELTPDTSYGFDVIDFARRIGWPLDPWQEWLVIHLGELLPDGRPRFRTVLVLVARQNGKTHLLVILALYWMFVEGWPLLLGMSTNLEYAREAWDKAVKIAEETQALAAFLPEKGAVLRGNNDIHMKVLDRPRWEDGARLASRYKIAASNRRGGRSLSVDRLIVDELREHDSWDAWDAATNAMNARPFGQAVAITNQGDMTAVVLDSLRAAAMAYLETGEGDESLGLFEWSMPDGADVTEIGNLAMSNPNLGLRIHPQVLLGPARRAALAGGEQLDGFRTEVGCQKVRTLNAAVDARAWQDCEDAGTLDEARGRVALFLDMSPDQLHATLCAAALLPDGRVRVETVESWSGASTGTLRTELRRLVRKIRPRVFGWIPGGPAAALAADLADRRKTAGRTPWPPPGVEVVAVRDEVPALCMGFATAVAARRVAHSGEALLNAHVLGASKVWQGDVWRFERKSRHGDSETFEHVDAAYAAAGAVHVARTLPASVGAPRLIVVGDGGDLEDAG